MLNHVVLIGKIVKIQEESEKKYIVLELENNPKSERKEYIQCYLNEAFDLNNNQIKDGEIIGVRGVLKGSKNDYVTFVEVRKISVIVDDKENTQTV